MRWRSMLTTHYRSLDFYPENDKMIMMYMYISFGGIVHNVEAYTNSMF